MENFTSPLNNLKIASPCAADWNAMVGDARQRFCGECKLNVYNISGMTRAEAENLLKNSEGRLCVRFYKRADGTILTQDCPVGWAKVKQKISRIAAAFSLLMGIFGGIFAFGFLGKPDERKNFVTMGAVTPINKSLSNVDSDFQNEQLMTMGNIAVPEFQGEAIIGKLSIAKKKGKGLAK